MSTDPSLPPSLLPSISLHYSQLNEEEKRVFNKVFMSMWDHVAPLKRFIRHGGVLYGYWVVNELREEYGLSPVQLSVLTYIYHCTGGGKYIVNAHLMYQSPNFPCTPMSWPAISAKFKHLGYVVRTSRNPAQPFLSGFDLRHSRKYLRMTTKGINVIRDIEKEMYRRIMRVTFDDVICGYNKGQPL